MAVARKTVVIAAFACLTACLGLEQASACEMAQQQNFKIFRSAEVILVAKVVAYEAVPSENHAIFEFETVRLIVGAGMYRDPPKRWRAEWTNSTFGEPQKWDPKLVIVGLGAKINRKGEPTIHVLQQSCSRPSIIPASEETLHAILKDAEIHFHPNAPILKNIPWQ